MRSRGPGRPLFWVLCLWLIANFSSAQDLSWAADIVPTEYEKQLAEADALSRYFPGAKKNTTYFPSWEVMKQRVGEFVNVNASRIKNHDYNAMTAWLKQTSLNYPNITHLYSIGKSVEGRELWVLIVSDNPKEHEFLEPELKIVGNMHGNEVVGREALLYLIDVLCQNYGKNMFLTDLVNDSRMHFLVSMNPDGYEKGYIGDRVGYAGRSNAHDIDLNRNFPAMHPEHREQSGGGDPEKENEAVMKWLQEYPFVLSANLHGGSLVANYPYDDSETGQDEVYSPSSDDVLFVELSYRYARAHSKMWKTGRRCGLSPVGDNFLNGITNGARWYHLAGGMQDWQYEHTNCLEITIEMGCFKFPTDDMLPKLWEEHQFAMLSFLEMGLTGIYGIVTDRNNRTVANATISVEAGKDVKATEKGEYWRLLPPGDHTITVSGRGLESDSFTVTVVPGARAVRHDVTLLTCGDTESRSDYYVRGRGKISMAVVAFNDSLAASVLHNLAKLTCAGDFSLDDDISLFIAPDANAADVVEHLRVSPPSSVVVVSAGSVESIVFSNRERQPQLFDKQKLDQSLVKALGYGEKCEKPIRDQSLATNVDDLNLQVFELGIAVGCEDVEFEKKAATVGTVLNIVKNAMVKDSVKEYSVVPSANPSDHFTPQQAVMATSATLAQLESSSCVRPVAGPNEALRMVQMGSGLPPYNLIVAIEKRTEAMVYEMMTRWCDDTDSEGVDGILSQSTFIFLPEIPHTQLNCHDYNTISPFKKLFDDIIKSIPQIDFIMLFGTGGLKVRYINSTLSVGDKMATVYKSWQDAMKGAATDACSRSMPNERDSIKGFLWNDTAQIEGVPVIQDFSNPDALLAQVGCCYENLATGHFFDENRLAIKHSFEERIRGVRITADDVPTEVVVDGKRTLKLINGKRFINLDFGSHHIKLLRNGLVYSEFNVEITPSSSTIDHSFISSSAHSNVFVVATVALLLLIACLFTCRQRVTSVLNRRGFFTGLGSRKGFERIPLYKSDDEDEDEVFDLQKL